ncbi:hypothetical protein ACIQFP_20855 [Nocardiopsis alba]|uniref:hypothetical protein n=1 Tax=Nocardiopsis alba TaxID=53437 RepID=UPI00381EEDFD
MSSPRIEPVLEVDHWRFLPLSGDLSPTELETFLTTWAEYNDAEDPRGLLDQEMTLFPGGLRVIRASGASVNPGCCCGLEDWREWSNLLDRTHVWMGHDPGVVQEFVGDKVRFSQEGRELRIDLPLRDLPGLLTRVHEDLRDLLTLVERERGAEVAALLDRDLHISDPLDLP